MAKDNASCVMKKTMIGGQALIEGVMMKGPDAISMAVRKSDGSIVKDYKPLKNKGGALRKIPFVRGIFTFADMLRLGVSCITYSASQMDEGENYEPDKFDMWIDKKFGREKGEKIVMSVAMVFGVAIPILLFFILPTLVTGWIGGAIGSSFVRNLIEGAIRIVVFLVFLFSISRMKDMKRTFSYHGAEHKTIFTYEKGLELTVENAHAQSRFHPRCGTSFLFVVMIVAILVTSLFTWQNALVRVLIRLALLPVIVGISYEINRLVGRYDNWFTKAIRWPGLMLQHLTTNEPDDSMLEVAIEALKPVIPADGVSDKW